MVAVAEEGRWIATEAPVDRERRRRRFAEDLERDDTVLLVADVGGQLVGQLGLVLARYGVADLGMLVADGWRQRGSAAPCCGRASTGPGRREPTRSPCRSGPTTAPQSPSTNGSASSTRGGCGATTVAAPASCGTRS